MKSDYLSCSSGLGSSPLTVVWEAPRRRLWVSVTLVPIKEDACKRGRGLCQGVQVIREELEAFKLLVI